MTRSHWIGGRYESGEMDQHLLTFTKHAAPGFEDELLAQRIGELDPFVLATETNKDMVLDQVVWFIEQHEKFGT